MSWALEARVGVAAGAIAARRRALLRSGPLARGALA